MFSQSNLEIIRTKGSVMGRVLMGLVFLMFGITMLMSGPANSVGFYEAVGVPFAGIVVWLVVALKIIAGAAIVFGKKVTEAAAALIIFTLIATLLAHMDFADPMQMTQALKNLAIVGGLLYLMAFGPGGTNVTNDGIRD